MFYESLLSEPMVIAGFQLLSLTQKKRSKTIDWVNNKNLSITNVKKFRCTKILRQCKVKVSQSEQFGFGRFRFWGVYIRFSLETYSRAFGILHFFWLINYAYLHITRLKCTFKNIWNSITLYRFVLASLFYDYNVCFFVSFRLDL